LTSFMCSLFTIEIVSLDELRSPGSMELIRDHLVCVVVLCDTNCMGCSGSAETISVFWNITIKIDGVGWKHKPVNQLNTKSFGECWNCSIPGGGRIKSHTKLTCH